MPLLYTLLATFFISAGALIGAVTLKMNHHRVHSFLMWLVALSAGTLIGGAFLHLLPEATEALPAQTAYTTVLAAYIVFFLIENVLHWHHCHDEECENHSIGYMNLIGDGLHNVIDGLIIAAAFVTDTQLGIATALAVALHEIPQEIGDYGVLLHAGFKPLKALLLNYGVALGVVLGGVIGIVLGERVEAVVPYLLPIAAGGFIYIGSSDLVPQLKNKSLKYSLSYLAVFIIGISLMYALTLAEVGH